MVIGCPNLRTFVPTNLKTPKLEGVYEDKIFKTPQWKGDLNTTLEHIFKGKVRHILTTNIWKNLTLVLCRPLQYIFYKY